MLMWNLRWKHFCFFPSASHRMGKSSFGSERYRRCERGPPSCPHSGFTFAFVSCKWRKECGKNVEQPHAHKPKRLYTTLLTYSLWFVFVLGFNTPTAVSKKPLAMRRSILFNSIEFILYSPRTQMTNLPQRDLQSVHIRRPPPTRMTFKPVSLVVGGLYGRTNKTSWVSCEIIYIWVQKPTGVMCRGRENILAWTQHQRHMYVVMLKSRRSSYEKTWSIQLKTLPGGLVFSGQIRVGSRLILCPIKTFSGRIVLF